MPNFIDMDADVPLAEQLEDEGGPVVLINTFVVATEDAEGLVEARAEDAAVMKRQPGFIPTQSHRGIAGSGVFLNDAVWQSTAHFRTAFGGPEFRARLAADPADARISPHLFRKVELPGICVA